LGLKKPKKPKTRGKKIFFGEFKGLPFKTGPFSSSLIPRREPRPKFPNNWKNGFPKAEWIRKSLLLPMCSWDPGGGNVQKEC